MLWHVTACFYGGPQTAYPVVLDIEAASSLLAIGVVGKWPMPQWRTHFPKEVRDLIRSEKDITIVNVETEVEKMVREDEARLALLAAEDEAAPVPVEEPKTKKKRGPKKK